MCNRAPTGKQSKCPPTGVRIPQMCLVHTMKYYSAMKKEKSQSTHTGYKMGESANLYAAEEVRSRRLRGVCFHPCTMSRDGKSIRGESRFIFAWAWSQNVEGLQMGSVSYNWIVVKVA